MPETVEIARPAVSSYRSNPSVEHLMASLVNNRHALELLEVRHKDDAEQSARLQMCKKTLDEAEAALMKKPFRKTFLAWDLLHQVSEEMILLLNQEELAAEGKKVEQDFKLSSLPEIVKNDWLGRLEGARKALESGPDSPPPAPPSPPAVPSPDVKAAYQTIKMALQVLDSQTDNLFWDIWTKKLFGFIYTVLLIISMAILVCLCSRQTGFLLSIGNVLLLGAIGGFASGILSAEPQYIAKGQFWVSSLYYTLVRPTLGALAALLVFLMLQSQYLIQIKPPADCRNAVMNSLTCPQDKPQGMVQPDKASPAKAEGEAQSQGAKQEKPPGENSPGTKVPPPQVISEPSALIILTAVSGQQIYLYILVLLLAGFSGDKVLKAVTDKTFSKLFQDAEKTKAAK
ncbi:MAG: hypothetical protein PHN75_19005 [Syntrophales bacterium]|nr:hypothetical protein [Syntrophales bacterium]